MPTDLCGHVTGSGCAEGPLSWLGACADAACAVGGALAARASPGLRVPVVEPHSSAHQPVPLTAAPLTAGFGGSAPRPRIGVCMECAATAVSSSSCSGTCVTAYVTAAVARGALRRGAGGIAGRTIGGGRGFACGVDSTAMGEATPVRMAGAAASSSTRSSAAAAGSMRPTSGPSAVASAVASVSSSFACVRALSCAAASAFAPAFVPAVAPAIASECSSGFASELASALPPTNRSTSTGPAGPPAASAV